MKKVHLDITAEKIRSGELTPREAAAPMFAAVDLSGSYIGYISDVSLFNGEQTTVFSVAGYLDSVCAGGHEKFLYNPEGRLWREAILALDIIGAEEAAENLRNVRNKFPEDISFDLEARAAAIEENDLYFDEEDAYIKEHESEVRRLLEEYTKANAEAFEFTGDVEFTQEQ